VRKVAKDEFDTAKGAFYLVAIIIVTQMVISLFAVAACMYGRLEQLIPVDGCKNISGPMMELFQMSFTSAIAFAGGGMSAPKPPRYEVPDKEVEK
jgi:hypothetical protein